MPYKTTAEMLERMVPFTDFFRGFIPDTFEVHPDYLIDGLDAAAFREGYEAFRQRMLALHSDMCSRPREFGLLTTDKKGIEKPCDNMHNHYVWLFLALGQSSQVESGIMKVDGPTFAAYRNGKSVGKNDATPHNPLKLVERLRDHGFTVEGELEGDFTISDSVPGLMAVIKAASMSKEARASMTSDYPHFNWRLYQYGIDERVPFNQTYSYQLMTSRMQRFSDELIRALADKGWKSYVFFPHSDHGGRLTFPTIEYYYNLDGGTILVRANGTKATPEFLETLPPHIADMWKDSTRCKGCRKECNNRIKGEFFGRTGTFCKGDKVHIPAGESADVKFIVASGVFAKGVKL